MTSGTSIGSWPARAKVLDRQFQDLATGFARYVRAYDGGVPFSTEQLKLHLQTIERRRSLGSAARAACDAQFAEFLYDTLRAWRIGVRSSRLIARTRFRDELERHAEQLATFDGVTIGATEPERILPQLWRMIASLAIVENEARLVAVTKTLHHLLPDLVPPMDRAWTGRFLGIHPPHWQSVANQRRIFETVFTGLSRVAREVDLEQFVGAGWRSSTTKILDNALIGYCLLKMPAPTRKQGPHPRTASGRFRSSSSYAALREWLTGKGASSLALSFARLESILGRPLPPSAHVHRAWWANHASNPQASAWLAADWRVETVDLRNETVRFRKE